MAKWSPLESASSTLYSSSSLSSLVEAREDIALTWEIEDGLVRDDATLVVVKVRLGGGDD
jgi:hypothetical protein